MKKNLFENIKFGDRFLCKNGKMAIYTSYSRTGFDGKDINFFTVQGYYDNMYSKIEYASDGKCLESMPNPIDDWNIISIYKDSPKKSNSNWTTSSTRSNTCSKFMDEEKLDKLAAEYICNYSDGMDNDPYITKIAYNSFIAGYHKAKEE